MGFFKRLVNKVKDNLSVIAGAFLVGGFAGAGSAVLTVLIDFAGEEMGLWAPSINDLVEISELDLTPKEEMALEQWNDNEFIPFVQMLESFLLGDNDSKNKALMLMQLYVIATEKQNESYLLKANPLLSFEACQLKLAYIIGVFAELSNIIDSPKEKVTVINASDYASDFSGTALSNHLPTGNISVKLMGTEKLWTNDRSDNDIPVDIDLNNSVNNDIRWAKADVVVVSDKLSIATTGQLIVKSDSNFVKNLKSDLETIKKEDVLVIDKSKEALNKTDDIVTKKSKGMGRYIVLGGAFTAMYLYFRRNKKK